MLERRQLTNIGFDGVVDALETCSPFGDELRRRLCPFAKNEREALLREHENTRILAAALEKDPKLFTDVRHALMQMKDVRRSVAASRQRALTDVELFEVKRFLIALEAFVPACEAIDEVAALGGIELFGMTEALDTVDPDGRRAVTFRLGDALSEELASVRRERKEVDVALRSAYADKERSALEAKRLILAAREENEELRLRGEMTKAFSAHADRLLALIGSIGRLDLSIAKAMLLLSRGGCVPELTEGEEISFEGMTDPMIADALKAKGRAFTPISIRLIPGSTVITGANMGGKSVAVKTLALNAHLALSGMPVFALSASLPQLCEIHLLAEDMESSESGLSSFGGEMVRFDSIIRSAETETPVLVLLDEFARGTNPHEGSSLVRAAVRYFNEVPGVYALITTHFDGVARFARTHYQVMGLKNADEKALEAALSRQAGERDTALIARFMDYGLFLARPDAEPPRDALRICRALGISKGFMDRVGDAPDGE